MKKEYCTRLEGGPKFGEDKFRGGALALLLAFAVVPSAPAFADTQVGVNAAIRNSVQEKQSNDAALHPAVIRAPVHLGDAIVSGDQSALQLLLLDQSVFTVGANARVTVDRFVYDPNRGTSDVAASVAKGAFRFMSGHSLSGFGKQAITTPVATIGVRGTMLEGAVGEEAMQALGRQPGAPACQGDSSNATLVVLRGPGLGTKGFDKIGAIDVTSGGVTVSVDHAGQATLTCGPGQPPIGPFTLGDGAFDELNLFLRTTPGGGGDNSDFDPGSAGGGSGDTNDPGPTGSDPYGPSTGTIDFPPPERPNTGITTGGQ
jgi:hypothetical protein